jgi:transposase
MEFRRDVVAVVRKGEAPLAQIAKEFGISESCLHRWLKIADVDDGIRCGETSAESAELREIKRRNRTFEGAHRPPVVPGRRAAKLGAGFRSLWLTTAHLSGMPWKSKPVPSSPVGFSTRSRVRVTDRFLVAFVGSLS